MAYETEDHETQFCFPAVNSSCIRTERPKYEYNIMYWFFSLLALWTVFLNLLVIVSISHFKKLHTPTNLLILSLAVADLLVGLVVMPVEAIKLIEMCWYFGDTFCAFFLIFIGLILSASFNNLIFIALDRFLAVIYPLLYTQKITIPKTIVAIFLNWLCSSAYTTVGVLINKYINTDTSQTSGLCYGECGFVASFAWRVTDLIVANLMPCIVIISLYLRIFHVARQQVKVINSLVIRGKHVTEGSARKSESKAALTLGIIVAIHLLCYVAAFPLYVFAFKTDLNFSANTVNVLIWMLYANSSLNPLVYAFFYPWFRRALKLIVTLKILCPMSALIDVSACNY